LRARKRCIEGNEEILFSCCSKRKKKKKKSKRQRKERETLSNLSENETHISNDLAYSNVKTATATAYCGDSVVNPLKLIRTSFSTSEFKIETKNQISSDLNISLPKISPTHFSSTNNSPTNLPPTKISAPDFSATKHLLTDFSSTKISPTDISSTKHSPTELDNETGFSRYRDTCLDFGDLVRQSKLKLGNADKADKVKTSKKHRHSKCKKHRHRIRSKSKDHKHQNENIENVETTKSTKIVDQICRLQTGIENQTAQVSIL